MSIGYAFLLSGIYEWYTLIRKGVRAMNELDSTCGISDDELTERFKEAIRIDNEIKKIKGVPIAGYDEKKKTAYLEYPDGRRRYAAK